MRTYKLYTNTTGTQNNAANVTIAKSGRIQGVRWAQTLNSVVDNDEVQVELSLIPISMIGSNDSAGSISQTDIVNNGTSGGAFGLHSNESVDVPVGLGEKLYLNAVVAGTPGGHKCTCFVDIEE